MRFFILYALVIWTTGIVTAHAAWTQESYNMYLQLESLKETASAEKQIHTNLLNDNWIKHSAQRQALQKHYERDLTAIQQEIATCRDQKRINLLTHTRTIIDVRYSDLLQKNEFDWCATEQTLQAQATEDHERHERAQTKLATLLRSKLYPQ